MFLRRAPPCFWRGRFSEWLPLGLRIRLLVMLSLLMSSLWGALSAHAQTPTPQTWTVTIGQFDVSKYPEITLYLNVTDAGGQQVKHLKREDFYVTEDGTPVAITAFAGVSESRPVDIVFVFDTTASMNEEIVGLVNTSLTFADLLVQRGRDYRLGLVTFGDEVLQVQRPDNTLTASAQEFKDWVSALRADGGQWEPENDYAALQRALQMQFRNGTQIVLILITDAPIHRYGDPPDSGVVFDDPKIDLQPTLDRVKEKGAAIYAIAPDLPEFTRLTVESSGRLYNIRTNPDFGGLVEEIGTTLANQYRITYRSPRPTYDGTRRDVRVLVGAAEARKAYAEQHLLNVQSNCLVGFLCLIPLLAALLLPPLGRALWRLANPVSAPVSGPSSPTPPASPQPSGVTPQQAVPPPPTPPTEQAVGMARCPQCGGAVRSGAKFCNWCGAPLSSVQS